MPATIDPMKARLERPSAGVEWQFEIKWDGYRAVAFGDGRLRLQGRRLDDITSAYPEIDGLEGEAEGRILDGELVVLDGDGRPDFQLMQARRDLGLKAHFMIFDLLWAEGRDLRSAGYDERRSILESLDLTGDAWSVPERIDATLDEALVATTELGLEGIVAKDPASPYVGGRRSLYWRKVKHLRRQEFVIGGWLPGKGHREATLGALLVGVREAGSRKLRFAGRVGTGMGDRLLAQLSELLASGETAAPPFDSRDLPDIPRDAHWCLPEQVIEVRFAQWTTEGRLRNPSFVGLRPDKSPDQVVREET